MMKYYINKYISLYRISCDFKGYWEIVDDFNYSIIQQTTHFFFRLFTDVLFSYRITPTVFIRSTHFLPFTHSLSLTHQRIHCFAPTFHLGLRRLRGFWTIIGWLMISDRAIDWLNHGCRLLAYKNFLELLLFIRPF